MRWYSIKKYKPPSTNDVYFVMTRDGMVWTAFHVGNNNWQTDTDSAEILGITHFCIPDPVEIEES